MLPFRAEKTEVLSEDLQNAEKKVELLKTVLQNMVKKLAVLLHAYTVHDQDKKLVCPNKLLCMRFVLLTLNIF